jgi:uncharacterized membrane protein YagU involved in acid resistance
MKQSACGLGSLLSAGVAAGLAGTAVMIAARYFDQSYAPRTVPKTREDPGAFLVHAAERLTRTSRSVAKPVEKSAAMALHVGYGTTFGALYALWRGRRPGSALRDGALLGAAVYAASYLGWLPAVGLSRPIWKQKFPEIAGELTRHVAYGIATAASYGALGGRRQLGETR